MFDDAAPELVFHLAAEVGGIGANRENPGRYWYANLMMGAHVLEQARVHETPKLVIAGTICAYPKHAPLPFREEDLWNGYPEETNAPYGVAKKALLVGAQAYREQYGLDVDLPPPGQPLRPARQLPPDARARHPRSDPEDASTPRKRARRDRPLGRRHADARVPLRRRLRRGPPAGRRALRRPRAGEHRDGRGDLHPRPRRARRRRDRVRGVDPAGTPRSRTGSPGAAWTRVAPSSSSASARRCRCATGSSAPSPGTAPPGRHVSWSLVRGDHPSRGG